MIELDEESLRQLMSSPHGDACGIAILEGVSNGKPLLVLRSDGNSVTLATPEDAQHLLQALGWKTNYKTPPRPRHRKVVGGP